MIRQQFNIINANDLISFVALPILLDETTLNMTLTKKAGKQTEEKNQSNRN